MSLISKSNEFINFYEKMSQDTANKISEIVSETKKLDSNYNFNKRLPNIRELFQKIYNEIQENDKNNIVNVNILLKNKINEAKEINNRLIEIYNNQIDIQRQILENII